jgi:signal transduction histidine kinase
MDFLKLNPKLELNIEEVNLHLLIRQAIDLFSHQAKQKKTLI